MLLLPSYTLQKGENMNILDVIIEHVCKNVPHRWSLKNISETRNNYSFLFQHIEDDIIYEEDRLVIVTDKEGNIVSSYITETPHDPQIKIMQRKGAVVRKIKKDMYYLYSGEPLEDFYNTIDKKIKMDGKIVVTIRYLLDENGNVVGQMIPPPFDGLRWSGCKNTDMNVRCDTWNEDLSIAYSKFSEWCDTLHYLVPDPYGTQEQAQEMKDQILSVLSDEKVKLYFAVAHGSAGHCSIRGNVIIWYREIWDPDDPYTPLFNRDKIRFALLCHCGAMDYTHENTWSYRFSKGDPSECAVIGARHLTCNQDAWLVYRDWMRDLLQRIDTKIPIYDAYEDSLLIYPEVTDASGFYGDETFTFLTIPIFINNLEPEKTQYNQTEEIELTLTCTINEPNRNGLIKLYLDNTKLSEHYLYFQNNTETFAITMQPITETGYHNVCVYNEDEDSMSCITLNVTDSDGDYEVTIDSIKINSIPINSSPTIVVYASNPAGSAITQQVLITREGVEIGTSELSFEDGETSKTFIIDNLPVETTVGQFTYCVELI